jgi:hypothetical protein
LATANYTGNGTLLGFGTFGSVQYNVVSNSTRVFTLFDPNTLLLTNQFGEGIFPFAMYRFQVPNANFPSTSGDVIQVAPLMENIAYQTNGNPGQLSSTTIQDPFVVATVVGSTGIAATPTTLYLWLKDSQPQISGARYKYVLVRFKANREIDQLIPTNEVEVP